MSESWNLNLASTRPRSTTDGCVELDLSKGRPPLQMLTKRFAVPWTIQEPNQARGQAHIVTTGSKETLCTIELATWTSGPRIFAAGERQITCPFCQARLDALPFLIRSNP